MADAEGETQSSSNNSGVVGESILEQRLQRYTTTIITIPSPLKHHSVTHNHQLAPRISSPHTCNIPSTIIHTAPSYARAASLCMYMHDATCTLSSYITYYMTYHIISHHHYRYRPVMTHHPSYPPPLPQSNKMKTNAKH